jgi:hypothetical protein
MTVIGILEASFPLQVFGAESTTKVLFDGEIIREQTAGGLVGDSRVKG